MSGSNPSEFGKSQHQEHPITRSQANKNIELANFVARNPMGILQPKRTVTAKKKVTKHNFENISYKAETKNFL